MKIKTTREIVDKTPKYKIGDNPNIDWDYNTKWITVKELLKHLHTLKEKFGFSRAYYELLKELEERQI